MFLPRFLTGTSASELKGYNLDEGVGHTLSRTSIADPAVKAM